MKKEVILVPKDKCPLDVLAELGDRTRDAWIFLHLNALEKLKHTSAVCYPAGRNRLFLAWEATEEYPAAEMVINVRAHMDWVEIFRITASDIAFSVRSTNPEEIYFLKMDE